jgi:hypothetical protein
VSVLACVECVLEARRERSASPARRATEDPFVVVYEGDSLCLRHLTARVSER